LQRLERGASATNTDYHYQCYAPGIKQKATSACFASPYGMVESGRYWRQKKKKKKKKKKKQKKNVLNLVVSSPPATEETEATEIESRQGLGW
jgi:hypothetical protein